MFRIRRIFDDTVPLDRSQIEQVKRILLDRFPGAPREDSDLLAERLRNPVKYRFRSILFVADAFQRIVKGFALVLHDRELGFLYLDYLATNAQRDGSGIGGALYTRVREEARALQAKGIFFECLPDERSQCPNEAYHRQNVARLRFYERFGARPIIGTKYETPLNPGGQGAPHLVYDGLDSKRPLRRADARAIVRAILERKYQALCPPGYIRMVVDSFTDDPVRLREPRYVRQPEHSMAPGRAFLSPPIALVSNTGHDLHHVHSRGYVEAPVRIPAIQRQLEPSGLFHRLEASSWGEKHITAVHDPDFYNYLKRVCTALPEKQSIYPYVFPIRNRARPPIELPIRAGYYCIDTFTPLNRNAFFAARSAVGCTLTAAEALLYGSRLAYSLVRPPGHHAERGAFGGFCYFNNTAIAANYLAGRGKVAVLDIDYHHGNGQQEIFYGRADVLTVSIHGHPRFAYPYFSGFAEETGEGPGSGFNLNIPLPEKVEGADYRKALARALERIRDFAPAFLVVALGLDTARGDPTGTWSLRKEDFRLNGRLIGELFLPTLVVQEGGYRTRTLGINARHFFEGLVESATGQWPNSGKGRNHD
jgi:acetoin utilization deacetylase AcuC-like enzyme/GNAT superfamily N-acetyltransferase